MISPEDLLFGIDLRARPGVTLRGFQCACRRVHGGQKVAQLQEAPCLFDVQQKLWLALQVLVARAAIGGGPGKFQGLVIGSEFDREIRLHASARERVVAWPAAPEQVARNSPSALVATPRTR